MKIRNNLSIRNAIVALIVLLLFNSCRKTEKNWIDEQKVSEEYNLLETKFFNATSADEEVQKVAADIKKQDSIYKFLPDFVKKNGIPRWDKTLYKTKGNVVATGSTNQFNSSTISNSSSNSNLEADQGLFFIPLQAQNSQEVKSYITAYKHGDSSYTYKLYNKDSLSSNSYQNGDTKQAVINSLGILAFFEKSINNQQTSQYNLSNNEIVEFKNANVTLSDAVPISQSARISDTSSTASTVGCSYSITVTETWTEINVYINGELVYHYESYEVNVVAVFEGDCNGGGGGGSEPGGGSSGWYNWGTGYNGDPFWNTYNYNGWLYPWWTSGGGGGSTGGFGFPYDFNYFNLFNGIGGKPISEYSNTAKCQGIQDIWNNYTNNEVMSFITADGKLIVTDVVPLSGGTTSGLYKYNDPATNTTQYYYTYPVSQGAPSQSYAGMSNNGQYYFIPVVASIHTHTPCRTDGTNGVSQPVGPDDQALASNHPGLRNWVIGCGAIAQFDSSNSNFFNVQSGALSATCSTIN